MTAFEEMGILPEIAKAVDEMEWTLPTDIQAEAVPLILGGGDVLMAAETGSGKTGAFCLPVLQIVWETMYDTSSKKASANKAANSFMLCAKDMGSEAQVSNDGLKIESKNPRAWQGVRTNKGVKRTDDGNNKFYYEAYFSDAGLARVGWSFDFATLDLGTDRNGWGFGGTGKKSNSKNFENYGVAFGDRGDVIGNLLDLDAGTISWYKNGEDLGVAYRLTPQQCSQTFFPTVCTKNAMISVNFQQQDNAKYKVPPRFNWVSHFLNTNKVVSNRKIEESGVSNENKHTGAPKAIILEPSRELAEQTFQCLQKFKKYLHGDVKILLVVGGVNIKDQLEDLRSGVDIIVATPGRLIDFVDKGNVNVNNCHFYIIDEIDGLLQQGNRDLIVRLHSMIPRMFDDGKRLQMIVCSATLHNFDVKKLAEKIMYFPTWVDLKGEDSVPETVHHIVLRVDPREDFFWKSLKRQIVTDGVHAKDHLNYSQPNAETLSEAVKKMKGEFVVKAIDSLKIDQAIIFCRTKLDCDNLENYLNTVGGGEYQYLCAIDGARNPKNNYSCVCLHSDRRPQERTANLEYFKARKCKFLICTDVAARGIDVKGVPFVIQVTLPDEKANYVHRIGRVGRAERMGLAISLVSCIPEKVWYHSNCNSRGKNCFNTRLTTEGGCCIWYNELQLLADIEESLNCTIQTIGPDFKIEVNEFDGKVVYGQKKKAGTGINYASHVEQLSDVVSKLSKLEEEAQLNFLNLRYMKKSS
ncbi:ATP-dependent RNA helicase DDX1-like protein [Leptotrombidium deliense]|uniref:ATP-dependent RNA helicase n=1 Tax=Leptotrombidium deliense TaxID=299467 RepID=A0A443SQM2_9ACAR|nr:ATP-dependent RNA helicase DDX1-like protein [Leptotrombidium deliense]